MPNIAQILKDEMVRLARREARGDVSALRKALAAQRAEVVELKRVCRQLVSQVNRLERSQAKASASRAVAAVAEQAEGEAKLRFRPSGFAAKRAKLGLSAADAGLLVGGVSGQTVLNWENETSRPKSDAMPAIAAFRRLGKREAAAKLASLKTKGQQTKS